MNRISMLLLAAIFAVTLGASVPSFAQTTPPVTPAVPTTTPPASPSLYSPTVDPECTDIAGNKQRAFSGKDDGLLTEIYHFIQVTVGEATEKLFSAFTNNEGYKNAVYWAMVLSVLFFGIGFTIGVVQASFAEVFIRLMKFAIISAVVSPGGWTFFSHYMVGFFMNGTDELVKGVLEIGTGVSAPAGASPFFQLDRLADFLIQPDTLIAIMGATFAGGPYGLAMGGLMGIALWGFVSLLIKALKFYAVTFVARSLLLGIAPVFIVFLLFKKTQQMFVSWLNVLISMMLQPVLLFTFLSFFLVLIETASKDMMNTELCWTEFQNTKGTDAQKAFWRFKTPNGLLDQSQTTWEGSLSCLIEGKGKDGGACPEFPMNIVDVLSFLLLVYLAQRFSEIIQRISQELSSAFIQLDAGSKVDQFLSQAGSNVMKPSAPASTPPAAPSTPPAGGTPPARR